MRMTRLVLANAIYFKADWASEFNKESTSDQDFHLADGTTVSVPTMFQNSTSTIHGRECTEGIRAALCR